MTWLTDLWTVDDVWHVPEGWRNGRGVWGGLVSGQVVTAASHEVPAEWAPRSLTIAMMAPVPAGPVQCAVTDLKRGSAVRVRRVTLTSMEGEQLTAATVVFGAPRLPTNASAFDAGAPMVAPQADIQRVAIGPPLAPEFVGQLSFRPSVGFPYSATAGRFTAGWIGPVSGLSDPLTPAVIAAYADAWWVACLAALDGSDLSDGPPPVATVDFSLTFPQDPPPGAMVDDQGLWHVGEIVAGEGGYITEVRRLYDASGRLLALNNQVVAIGGRRKGQ